ncbi:MAG: hypothetical protein AAFN92_01000 [Bacteroidota bacterium]
MKVSTDFSAGIPYGNRLPFTGPVRGGGARRWCLLRAATVLRKGGRVSIRCTYPTEVRAFRAVFSQPLPDWSATEGPENTVPAVFGEFDFAATVGLWLEFAGRPAAALLSPYISTEGFAFTPAEYLELKDRIGLTRRRYGRLPPVSKALEDLNTGFFRHRSLEESRTFITDRLTAYLERANTLHRDYLLASNGYARASLAAARRHHRAWGSTLEQMLEEAHTGAKAGGRTARKAYAKLNTAWSEYRADFRPGAEPEFPRKPEAWSDFLDREAVTLREKEQTLVRENRAAALSLSPLTADPAFVDPSHLADLAARLEDLIREINEAGLYQLPVGGADAATTPRQLQLLLSVLDRLRNTRHHLPELDDFYARRHYWYDQPAHLRRLLAPLLELPVVDWEVAFGGWYFERCLERAATPVIASSSPDSPATSPLADHGNRLRIFVETEEGPAPRTPEELLVDLTGQPPPSAWKQNAILAWRPLQDTVAVALRLAGTPDPVRLFTQAFAPAAPPAWSAIYVADPPPTGGDGLRFQRQDAEDWRPFTAWNRESLPQLRWYFPPELTAAETTFLLREWEFLLATAPRVSIFHAWKPDRITQALLSDGFSADFLVAAFLRVAEAADTAPFDREALIAIGREVRTRCGLADPPPHPLAEHLCPLLAARLPGYSLSVHRPWRDTFLPLLLVSPQKIRTVLLPDGRLPGKDTEPIQHLRRQALLDAGLRCLTVNSARLWLDTEAELTRVLGAVAGAG